VLVLFLNGQEMSMSRKASIWSSATLLLLAGAWQCAVPAIAAPAQAPGDVAQITIRFDDLNLEQPAGVAALYWRIKFAARQVCGDPKPPGTVVISYRWRECVAQSVDRAVAALDRASVTAYHLAHTPSERRTSLAQR
jgi:UrcA family protein